MANSAQTIFSEPSGAQMRVFTSELYLGTGNKKRDAAYSIGIGENERKGKEKEKKRRKGTNRGGKKGKEIEKQRETKKKEREREQKTKRKKKRRRKRKREDVQSVEGLGLDRVEVGVALVELLERRVLQGGRRERLEVEELRVGRILLGENEIAERDRKDGLRAQPAVTKR
jgi:hypothetical protein